MRAASYLLAFFAMIAPAYAHGGYSPLCCSDRDCEPIPAKAVTKDGDVYTITLRPEDHKMIREAGVKSRMTFKASGSKVQKPINGDHHDCLSPTLELLCYYPPHNGG